MSSEMDDMELIRSQHDLGRIVVALYQGAFEESGDRRTAFWATAAAVYAMFKSNADPQDEGS